MTFGAVLLDWGGTITPFHDVDLLDLWRLAALELAPAHAGEVTARLAAVERRWWQAAENHLHSGSVVEIAAVASESLGVDVAAVVNRAVARRDVAAWTAHTVADPEALLLVHLLRARGLRVGLLTNTHWPASWHARLLARDGLLDLFHARVYANDLPVRKPHPLAFQAGMAALGIDDPSQVVYLGDRAEVDVAGAAAVGFRTVLLSDGKRPQGDRLLGDRLQGDGLQGARPAGDRSAGDRPAGDRSLGDRSASGEVRPDRVVRRLGQLLDALTSMERLPPAPRRMELPAIPTL